MSFFEWLSKDPVLLALVLIYVILQIGVTVALFMGIS